MKRRPNVEWRRDLPTGIADFASRRTQEHVRFYGQCITGMNIQVLAASCYLQGIEDATEVEVAKRTLGETDHRCPSCGKNMRKIG